MKLAELASKPQLVKVIIDDKEIVEKYGEELEFFINDRLPISSYTHLASLTKDDVGELYEALKDLILDEAGNPVLTEEKTLPLDLLTASVVKVTERLGK